MKDEQYVIIVELSAGNDSVGNMWHETLICNHDMSVSEIWEWVEKQTQFASRGRVIITKPGGKVLTNEALRNNLGNILGPAILVG
jgi:hypothetical protein